MDKLPLEIEIERDIKRDIEYGSTVAKVTAERDKARADLAEAIRLITTTRDTLAEVIGELEAERKLRAEIAADLRRISAMFEKLR